MEVGQREKVVTNKGEIEQMRKRNKEEVGSKMGRIGETEIEKRGKEEKEIERVA